MEEARASRSFSSPSSRSASHGTLMRQARAARGMLERAAKACKTELAGSEDDPSRDAIARDAKAMAHLVDTLLGTSDAEIVRVALGVMDGLKTALRSPREADDDARREICVVVLFGLSKLIEVREDLLEFGARDEDAPEEELRVACKVPGMAFEERAEKLTKYVDFVSSRSRTVASSAMTASTPTEENAKSKKSVVGGLARAFASKQNLSETNTPYASDDEMDRGKRQSTSSLCASPSRIFYSPEVLSGSGVMVNEATVAPRGTLICRICEQPIPRRLMADHNATCTGFRSSLGSSADVTPRTSGSFCAEEVDMLDKVTIDDFRIIKLISSGAYSRVFLAQKRATGDLYAVKAMRKRDLAYKNMMGQVVAERDALIAAANPFTIKLYYSFTSARHVYLVTEYANGGDLYSLLTQLGRLSERNARQYCSEIVIALEYVHSQGITHRDLKPGNCLISADGHIKLADFGLSRIYRDVDETMGSGSNSPTPYATSPVSPSSAGSSFRIPGRESTITNSPIQRMSLQASTRLSPSQSPSRQVHKRSASRHGSGPKGTPDYLAPEILLCEPCGQAGDWWALGAITFEMLVGVPPFNASTPLAIFSRIITGTVEWPEEDSKFSQEALTFVESLLKHDVEERLGTKAGADEVKAHSWFTAVDWERVYDKSAPSVFVPKPENIGDTSYFVPSANTNSNVDYPQEERRASESQASEEVVLMANDSDEEEPPDDEDGHLSEFTYTNLAELAMRNINVSSGVPSQTSSGLPRRGSIGHDLSTHDT